MKAATVWTVMICIISALRLLFSFALAFGAHFTYGVVVSYTHLQDGLKLPPSERPSRYFTFILGCISTVWIPSLLILGCIVGGCGCGHSRHPTAWLALFGIFDLLQALGLLKAIVMHRSYIPRTLAGCNSYNGPAAIKDMFSHEAAAETADNAARCKKVKCRRPTTTVTSRDTCREFVVADNILATSVMAILFLSAALALSDPSWRAIKRVYTGAVYLSRYRNQWHQHKAQTLQSTTPPTSNYFQQPISKSVLKSKFENALSDRNIALYFIRNSHFTDVNVLCKTSKHLRLTLLNYGSPGSKESKTMQSSTCQLGTKSECWGCGSQICAGCSVSVSPSVPKTTHHIVYCEPCCSQCYYRRVRDTNLRSKYCHHEKSLIENATRTVCSTCNRLSGAELCAKREMKEAQEISHLFKSHLRCGGCKRKLSPRGRAIWWVCTNCQGECNSIHHYSWSLAQT